MSTFKVSILIGIFASACTSAPISALDLAQPSPDLAAMPTPACKAAEACVPQNRCHVGTIDCTTEMPVCRDTGMLTRAADPNCGPLAYWPFDGNGVDAAGGRDVQLVGGPGFGTGLFGQALELKGNTATYAVRRQGGVDIDDEVFSLQNTDFTIQAWVNYYDLGNIQQIIEKFSGGGGPGWTLLTLGKEVVHACISPQSCSALISGSGNLGTLQWQHVVLRRSDHFELFRNGVSVATSAVVQMDKASLPLLIGKRNDLDGRGYPFNGRIDEVAIWTRALSDDEIKFLYNGGKGQKASEVN